MKAPFYKKAVLFSLSAIFCLQAYNMIDTEPEAPLQPESNIVETAIQSTPPSSLEIEIYGQYVSDSFNNMSYRQAKTQQISSKVAVMNDFLDTIEEFIKLREDTLGYTLSGKEFVFEVDWYINNTIEYKKDKDFYGAMDYFATPYETIVNKKGDCEDHAILKQFALKHLGFPEKNMRIAYHTKHVNLFITLEDGMYELDNDKSATRKPVTEAHAIGFISEPHHQRLGS